MTRRRPIFELRYYVLDDQNRVHRAKDVMEWGKFFESDRRLIASHTFGHEAIGEVHVSTVFIGCGMTFFETMIFAPESAGDLDGYQTRCDTYEEALVMHQAAIDHVKNAFKELAKASGA